MDNVHEYFILKLHQDRKTILDILMNYKHMWELVQYMTKTHKQTNFIKGQNHIYENSHITSHLTNWKITCNTHK